MSTLASLLAAAGEDNTDFTYWTEDQQNAFWDAVNDGGAAFAQEIVDYCVENGVGERGDVAGAAAQWGFDGLLRQMRPLRISLWQSVTSTDGASPLWRLSLQEALSPI